jgi:diguanylate cyclase (GGDEF)-like protein
MRDMGWLMIWGTTLLFIDSILIILLYERLGSFLAKGPTRRVILSAALVLTFDQIGFFMALKLFFGVPWDMIYGGWIAKMGAAVLYGVLTGLYLHFAESGTAAQNAPRRLSDVFDMLTYRQRYELLLKQTGRDALTGLGDRGSFEREAEPLIAAAQAAGRPLSLIVLDLDHFKAINDRHGHAAGDEALRQVGRALGVAAGVGDRVYRIGGEEFAVLADGMAHSTAMLVAERLRRSVASLAVTGLATPISVSGGVATMPGDGNDRRALFGTADRRLYAAKTSGRDRVVGRGLSGAAAHPSPVDMLRPNGDLG